MFKRPLFTLTLVPFLCSVLLAQGRGPAAERPLPEGNGKAIVEGACAQCHALTNVTSRGYNAAGWTLLLDRMIAVGAKVSPQQVPVLVDYLSRNFPPQATAAPVIVGGSAKVSFKEWDVPTPGSRPHDPLATRDGMIWYTGNTANTLGRLDPKTGKFTEFRPPTPQSGPHGLVEDQAGNIWFTANQKGYIGKLDPKNGEFFEYKMPAEVRDPHTAIFDQKGTLWFTAQGANMIGRIIPRTGEIKVVPSPTTRSNPYGMVVTSKGVPVYVEFGSNKVATIHPETMAIKEYVLPDPASRPRRIAITSDDIIWYSDYSRGYLGRLDLNTGQVKEWPSPGGAKSQPYGITALHDIIWYSESAVEPNTMVRFDPKTEKFQTWAIPAGGGVVRNMMPTVDGNIVIAESGLNKVGLVEIGK